MSYYGDDVLAFDTLEEKWSRIGKMPYGLVTSHWYAHKQPAIPFDLLLFWEIGCDLRNFLSEIACLYGHFFLRDCLWFAAGPTKPM